MRALSSTPNTRMNERKDWRKKEGRKVVKVEGEREKNWKRGREKERKKIDQLYTIVFSTFEL